MKVSFSVPLKPLSGKHKFAMLLAEEMRNQGICVTSKDPDVNIVFVKGLRKGCLNVYRLDGVWMNRSMNFKKKNKNIYNIMRQCNGVIYQNEFCRRVGEKFIGKFNQYKIIMNGSKVPNGVIPYKCKRPYILTFCRWRPHKRLKDTVNGFLHSELHTSYDLLVLGKNPDYVIKHPAVKYLGHKQGSDLWSIILGSSFVVHLAYIDWCPNTVVEALVAGKNVLHSPVGGTAEVVRDNGITVDDKDWNYEPIHLYKPPQLDMNDVADGFVKMLHLPPPQTDYLDIRRVASEYIDFLMKVK